MVVESVVAEDVASFPPTSIRVLVVVVDVIVCLPLAYVVVSVDDELEVPLIAAPFQA